MTGSVSAAIAFGSNVGDRDRHIREALARIAALEGVQSCACSRVRETAPVGGPPQGPFHNGVVRIVTTLAPRKLLAALLDIERAGGRVRREKNGPRTIDLDLVFHGDAVIDEPDLTLPHPRAHLRDFVLEPLAEVAPLWRHPTLHLTARELADRLAPRATSDRERKAASA